MTHGLPILRTNTIIYTGNWDTLVAFYRVRMQLPVSFSNDWFIEFELARGAYLSIADESRAKVKSAGPAGLTLSWQVEDIEASWQWLNDQGIAPEIIRDHPWGARTCYFYDPEGRRLELWSKEPRP